MLPEDAADVVRWRNEPTAGRQMFVPPPATLADHLRWYERMLERGDRREFVIIEQGTVRERPIGTIGLSRIDLQQRRAEYGILIGEVDARGRGLGREASKLILDHAFGALGLRRTYLHVFFENLVAIRLYRSLGFIWEGLLRAHALRDGEFEDVVIMGLLADEWSVRRLVPRTAPQAR